MIRQRQIKKWVSRKSSKRGRRKRELMKMIKEEEEDEENEYTVHTQGSFFNCSRRILTVTFFVPLPLIPFFQYPSLHLSPFSLLFLSFSLSLFSHFLSPFSLVFSLQLSKNTPPTFEFDSPKKFPNPKSQIPNVVIL